MKKYCRILCTLICAVIISGTFSGCKANKENEEEKGYVARTREEATEESNAEAVTNGNWSSMRFILDGTEMELKRTPYAALVAEGWSFDPVVYGLQDASAEIGAVYERNIYVNKEGYDPDVFLIGITNFNETPCGIDDVQLWSLEFIAKDKTNYPSVFLDGGVTWGADEKTVKKAYGEPAEIERHDENSCSILKYKDDAGKELALEVYDDNGLRRIVMNNYS